MASGPAMSCGSLTSIDGLRGRQIVSGFPASVPSFVKLVMQHHSKAD